MTNPTPSTRSTGSEGAEAPDRCQTWGYYTGRQCSEPKDHEGRHITEPAVGRFSAGRGAAPPSAPDPESSEKLRTRWHMESLIRYAVEVWGPESDVDPETDNASMRADLETFLDAEPAAAAPDPEGLRSVETATRFLHEAEHGYREPLLSCMTKHRTKARAILARLSPVEPTDKGPGECDDCGRADGTHDLEVEH